MESRAKTWQKNAQIMFHSNWRPEHDKELPSKPHVEGTYFSPVRRSSFILRLSYILIRSEEVHVGQITCGRKQVWSSTNKHRDLFQRGEVSTSTHTHLVLSKGKLAKRCNAKRLKYVVFERGFYNSVDLNSSRESMWSEAVMHRREKAPEVKGGLVMFLDIQIIYYAAMWGSC